MPSAPKNANNNANRKFATMLVTAVSAAVASTLCCIAPLIYLLFGVSSTWLIGLNELDYLRLPMLLLSLAAFGYGFWLLHFSNKIICSKYCSLTTLKWLYWIAFALILFFLTYPTVLPWFLEME